MTFDSPSYHLSVISEPLSVVGVYGDEPRPRQKSPILLEIRFAEVVIPDEPAKAGEIRNLVEGKHSKVISGSRLASAAGLGRDDEL